MSFRYFFVRNRQIVEFNQFQYISQNISNHKITNNQIYNFPQQNFHLLLCWLIQHFAQNYHNKALQQNQIKNQNKQVYKQQAMSLCTIRFQITCETKFGQVVYICGNTPQLGNWTPQNAMRLYTDGALYPKWDPYKSIFVRQGNKLLFKLCIVDQDKHTRWQSIPHNRQIIASQNLLIQFTANYQQITITPIVQQLPKAPRKKTCDILNQLQSDGSSSKQYWKQFMQEQQQESILYITLTTQMRRIAQYHSQQLLNGHQIQYNIPSQQFDQILKQKIQRNIEVSHKTSQLYCILQNTPQNDQLISVLGQDSYLIKRQQFSGYSIHSNQVPVLFHVESLKVGEENQLIKEVIDNIERIVHAENILLGEKQRKLEYYVSLKLSWQPTKAMIEFIIKKKFALIVIESQRILELFLELVIQLGLQYHTTDFTTITIFLSHMAIMKCLLLTQQQCTFYPLNTMTRKQRIKHQNKYFDHIKKLVLSQSNKSFLGLGKENFLESIKEDDTFLGLVYHRKNLLILNTEKIEDLSPKLLTQVIALSSKPNFEIYIILDKLSPDIKSRFPASKSNKIVVVGKTGTLYANEQTMVDVFANLGLEKGKFNQAILKIMISITLGLESKLSSSNQTLLEFKKGNVGKIGTEILYTKIKQHNEHSQHKLIVEQKSLLKYSIKPFILTDQFLVKAILQNLSKHIYQDRSMVMVVNMKDDNIFIHKFNTIFSKVFKHKNNIKLRNMQVIPSNVTEYSFIAREEIITLPNLELELEFICQHFLASSHIKSYHLNVHSTPQKNRRSFASKFRERHFQYSHQNL